MRVQGPQASAWGLGRVAPYIAPCHRHDLREHICFVSDVRGSLWIPRKSLFYPKGGYCRGYKILLNNKGRRALVQTSRGRAQNAPVYGSFLSQFVVLQSDLGVYQIADVTKPPRERMRLKREVNYWLLYALCLRLAYLMPMLVLVLVLNLQVSLTLYLCQMLAVLHHLPDALP